MKRAKRCSVPPIVMPVISGDWHIAMATGSMANKNNKGDIGQPWCVDLQSVKGFEIWLLVIIVSYNLCFGFIIQ